MKKLFLGCGCLVLLLLGGLGFLAYKIAPTMMESLANIEATNERFAELDRLHPFRATDSDGLAVDRFEAALAARVELREAHDAWIERIAASAQEGVFDLMRNIVDLAPLVEDIPDAIASRGLGPTEFATHVRVQWVALASIDSGVPGPDFGALRGRWSELRGRYQQMQRQHPALPRLDDLLGSFPPEVIDAARLSMARDPQRVLDGLGEPVVELVHMSIPPMTPELTQICTALFANDIASRSQAQPVEVR